MDRHRLREVRALYADVREGPFFWMVLWRLGFLIGLVGVCWLMKS